MENPLKHLVEITGHRDHNLLDISVIAALNDLIRPKQARALEIFLVREELYLRPRVWLKDGQVISGDEYADGEQGSEAITGYCALATCIEQRRASAEEITANNEHVLWVPVWLNDKVTTCLHIVRSAPYDPQTLSMVEGILNVYRNFQNLLDYSERDSLAGLLNRKTFDEKFAKMISASQADPCMEAEAERRTERQLKEHWLAVVDIDHFKRINDTFGHLYGDEVLILIANIMRTSFRSQDRIFRFGGEEFVILLRSTTLDDARMIFERFRSNVEHYSFPQVGQVTISLGFVSIAAPTPVVILGHADQALYYAKAHGRNQVCYYNELVSNGLLYSEVANDEVEFF